MGAHLHKHIQVMHHKHPGSIGLDPRNLELVFLPLWQQVIDGVPQLIMISAAAGGDLLPCSVGYCIHVTGPEGWTLVSGEHNRSVDDLHDCLVLFSARGGILLILNSGGVVMLMQFSKSLSLLVGIGASSPKVLISSTSWNVSSFSVFLQGV
jgi:hypothetical protein